MSERTDATWRRLRALGGDVAQIVRDRGLAGGARMARALLGEPSPEAPDAWASWERETLAYLLERFCAYGDDLPSPTACEALEETLGFLQTLPVGRRRQLHQLIAVVEAGSLVTAPGGARRRFTELPPEIADDYLAAWAESDLPPRRAVFQGLKSICMMGYWSRPSTWNGIGYDPDHHPERDPSASTDPEASP